MKTDKQPEALALADQLEAWAKDYATTDYADEMATKAAAELRLLHAALDRLERIYTHAFDRVDGGLSLLGPSIPKYEEAHRQARIALGRPLFGDNGEEDPDDPSPAPANPQDADIQPGTVKWCEKCGEGVTPGLCRRKDADMAWQPIETAPKDGTDVLLWESNSYVPFVGAWRDGRRPGWCCDTEHYDTDGNACVISNLWQEGITHWMPLPAQPKP